MPQGKISNIILEPSCCKKRQKSPGQETDLGNRGRLKVLNDIKLVLNEYEWPLNHNIIWYHSEVPYSLNQFLAPDFYSAKNCKNNRLSKTGTFPKWKVTEGGFCCGISTGCFWNIPYGIMFWGCFLWFENYCETWLVDNVLRVSVKPVQQ